LAAYKDRVRADLDRWIAAGLAPAENRAAMLAMLPETRRLDAATALAWVGGALLGIAIISFVAANWDVIPRMARFGAVLAAFALAAGAGAWAAHKNRPNASNIALTMAALIFAAAIGLTGQIFDIAGEPRAALYGSAIAALALALAGRSSGAIIAALVFVALADMDQFRVFDIGVSTPWMIVAGPLAAALAIQWRSSPLAHAGAAGVLFALFWFAMEFDGKAPLLLLFSIVLAGAAWLARARRASHDLEHAGVFYGWAAWGALLFFAVAGYADDFESGGWGVVHRLAWLLAAGGLIALGRLDRHLIVTAIGVLGLMGAIAALLMDLGVNLLTAAALFFVCALVALIGGLALRRKPKAPESSGAAS